MLKTQSAPGTPLLSDPGLQKVLASEVAHFPKSLSSILSFKGLFHFLIVKQWGIFANSGELCQNWFCVLMIITSVKEDRAHDF